MDFDLIIVGAGPAGLSASINAASEGLRVGLFDAADTPGGQAKESAAVENYPGFPEAVTGAALMRGMIQQAQRFGAHIACPASAAKLVRTGKLLRLTCDDFASYSTRSVLLSPGLAWRRLNAENIGMFAGNGVYYGIPNGGLAHLHKACTIIVVGGANSAGQAVLNLARNAKATIRLIVRKTLDAQMSQYLIDRIRATPNIVVVEGAEVVACYGSGTLSAVDIRTGDELIRQECSAMHIFIGAQPRTLWLDGTVQLNSSRYIPTGAPISDFAYGTNRPGIFAAGDVREGSVKRITTAVGEGVGALTNIHAYLSKGE